jgi:hypothetical protein
MPPVPVVPNPDPFLAAGAHPILLYIFVTLATVVVVFLGAGIFFLAKMQARADRLSDRLLDNTLATKELEKKVQSRKSAAANGG